MITLARPLRVGAFMVPLLVLCVGRGEVQATDELTQYRQARAKAAQRERRVIFNNDGDDHLLRGEASVEAFLAARTTPLIGSHVDTIVYCTSRPFGMFTHNTQIGDALTDKTAFAPERNNVVSDLIEQGTDPLRTMTEFCREHSLEILWSMRMNDTPDAYHSPDKPQFYWSSFKETHPEFLFGTRADRPAHGAWSAVDYAEPEVREFLFRVFEEICQGYDVDGIEMDFFRHLVLFRTVAEGGLATDEEREMLTDLVGRVRRMTEIEGMRRGKPILLSARVPDSVEYCHDAGIDIESWLDEGLIDLLVAGGDFRLNPWETSVELGKRHGVPVYCDLDPSIPYGLGKRFDRNSVAAYRARALNAWSAGAAGIYIFNCFNPKHQLWREIGDPEALRRMDKPYFVNVMGQSGYLRAASYLAGGEQHSNLPRLHPRTPVRIPVDDALAIPLRVGEDVAGAVVTCHLLGGGPEPPELEFNGQALAGERGEDGWSSHAVPTELVRQGINRVRVTSPTRDDAGQAWDVEYVAREIPPMPWSSGHAPAGTEAVVAGDALVIADRSEERGSYFYYMYPWDTDADAPNAVEANVKVTDGRSTIIIANGVAEEQVQLHPDRVEAGYAGLSWEFDATDAFHLYRVEIERSDIRVFVDGELRIDGEGAFTFPASGGRNTVGIGASSSLTTGEARWESVRLRTTGASLYDLVLTVDYPDEG